MNGDVKSAFFWAIGLVFGFWAGGKVLALFGEQANVPSSEVVG